MKRIFSLLSFLFITFSVTAQTQRGFVKTLGMYTEGKLVSGTIVPEVTVYISASPQDMKQSKTVTSGENGVFSFTAPAKFFYIPKIAKEGYAPVNIHLLSDRHIVSNEPLTVLLIPNNKQQEYEAEIRQKAQAGTQKEINKLLAKIKGLKSDIYALKNCKDVSQSSIMQLEDECRQHRSQLFSAYEQQEMVINDMVEAYKELDFDALEDFYIDVKCLIIDGKYQRADSLLNTRGELTAQINNLSAEQVALNNEKKELAERCFCKHEIFAYQFRNDSAAYYLELRAALDTTNVSCQNEAGSYISDYMADYDKALSYYQRALRQSKKQFGENSEWVATIFSYIGGIYYRKGNCEKALEHFQKSHDILQTVLGENHPKVAASLNYIGFVHYSQDNLKEALEYFQKALDIYLNTLGEKHLNVATTLNNIGVVYDSQDNYDTALEYYLKALDIRKALLDEHHPDVATSLNYIGGIYDSQGNYEPALAYYQEALLIRQTTLGEQHPKVASILNNIGGVHYYQDDDDAALEYFQKALDIRQAVLGEHHRDVAKSLHNIGNVYKRQYNYEKALEYYVKALDIDLSALGENNLKVAQSYNDIAFLYYIQGNSKKALEYYEKAYMIYQNLLGEQHEYTQRTKHWIESTQKKMEETRE